MSDEKRLLQDRAAEVHTRLSVEYPSVAPFLVYRNNFELLISVILSAQTTDAAVNEVAPELFATYPDARSLARADVSDLERIVHRTGFFRSKARNIKAAAAALVDRFDGGVPCEMDDLTGLPGVGRKTAHVVRGTAFGLPAVIVDTHFSRVTRRLGLTTAKDPLHIERDLSDILPAEIQHGMSMRVNSHGRAVCTARNPACSRCVLVDICLFATTPRATKRS